MQNHHSCGQIWRIIPSICWFWKKNKKQNAIKKMQLPCNIITIKKTSKSYDSSSFLFVLGCVNMIFVVTRWRFSGADLEFQVRGSALKKIAPSGGRCENFGGFWCEKLRFYAQKIIFFPILGGGGAPPGSAPGFIWMQQAIYATNQNACYKNTSILTEVTWLLCIRRIRIVIVQ